MLYMRTMIVAVSESMTADKKPKNDSSKLSILLRLTSRLATLFRGTHLAAEQEAKFKPSQLTGR